jgi:hypothetical protein
MKKQTWYQTELCILPKELAAIGTLSSGLCKQAL